MIDIKKLKDKEQRECISKRMALPRRCGGFYGHEGKHFYKTGHCFVPEEIWSSADNILDEWFSTHDHTQCEMLWGKLMRARPHGKE